MHTRRQGRNPSRFWRRARTHVLQAFLVALLLAFADLEVVCERKHDVSAPHVLPWNTSAAVRTPWQDDWCARFPAQGQAAAGQGPGAGASLAVVPPGKPCACLPPPRRKRPGSWKQPRVELVLDA